MKINKERHDILNASQDWLGRTHEHAFGVAYPKTEGDVIDVINLARKKKYKIKIRGGNTSLSGQTLISDKSTIVLDITRYKSKISLQDGLLKVSSGFTLFEINEFCKKFNRCVPLHMGSYETATIGGIASTNAGGMHAFKHGMAKNLIRGMRTIFSDGQVFEELTSSLKNNSLIGASDVAIGSEGKLCFISELAIQTVPIIKIENGILISVNEWSHLFYIFTALEENFYDFIEVCELFVQSSFQKGIVPNTFNLVIGLNNFLAQDKIEPLLSDIIEKDKNSKIFENLFSLSSAKYLDILKYREEIPVAHKEHCPIVKYDLAIPKHYLQDFYDFLSNHLDSSSFTFFGHFLDNNIHLNISKQFHTDELNHDITQFVLQKSGSLSAEHGIGQLKVDLYDKMKSIKSKEMLTAIKESLDPSNIFV